MTLDVRLDGEPFFSREWNERIPRNLVVRPTAGSASAALATIALARATDTLASVPSR